MRRWFALVGLIFGVYGWAECPPEEGLSAKDRINKVNQRYDDFFRYHSEREARQEQIQSAAKEVKIAQEIRQKEMERARQEYKRVPKDYAREEALRIQWEKKQKERDKAMEVARLCEVEQRRAVENALKKGRRIPPMKEFDLEGY